MDKRLGSFTEIKNFRFFKNEGKIKRFKIVRRNLQKKSSKDFEKLEFFIERKIFSNKLLKKPERTILFNNDITKRSFSEKMNKIERSILKQNNFK